MRTTIFIFLMLCGISLTHAQKYYSKTGKIYFLSEAPIEKIDAINNSAYVVLDASTGQFEMSVLIKGFKFEKALMQEHFNENYMESSKYPKGVFKGNITNLSSINFSKDGEYSANVKGSLTIHGVTKPLTTEGKIVIRNGTATIRGNFDIAIADYGIQVPKVVRDNIAKTVRVTVSADLQKM